MAWRLEFHEIEAISMSLGGSINPVESIAEYLQVTFDAGGKRIALPMSSAKDIPSIPPELFTKFQTSFYADSIDLTYPPKTVP